MCVLCNEEREIDLAIPQCSVTLIELNNTKIVIHQITCHLNAFPGRKLVFIGNVLTFAGACI